MDFRINPASWASLGKASTFAYLIFFFIIIVSTAIRRRAVTSGNLYLWFLSMHRNFGVWSGPSCNGKSLLYSHSTFWKKKKSHGLISAGFLIFARAFKSCVRVSAFCYAAFVCEVGHQYLHLTSGKRKLKSQPEIRKAKCLHWQQWNPNLTQPPPPKRGALRGFCPWECRIHVRKLVFNSSRPRTHL